MNKKRPLNRQGIFDNKIIKKVKSNDTNSDVMNDSTYSDISEDTPSYSRTSSKSYTPFHQDTSFSDSDSSIITGNDSSDFNERSKYGGPYIVRYNFNGVQNEITSKPDSKWTDDSDSERGEAVEVNVTRHITKIEGMVASFVKNIGSELQLLKGLTSVPSVMTSQAMMMPKNESNKKTQIVEKGNLRTSFVDLDIEALPIVFETPTRPTEYSIRNGIYRTQEPYNVRFDDAMSEPDLQTLNVVPHVENFNIQVIDDRNHAPNTYEVVDVSAEKTTAITASNIVATNKPDPNLHIANASGSNVITTPTRDNAQVAGSSNDVSQPKIRLPMHNIPEYRQIENVLEEEHIDSKPGVTMLLKRTVVNYLQPIENEPESKYMNRSIELLFDSEFFVDSVCWKREKNRVNIKGSFVLGCWKESFEKKYGQDVDDKRFMAHFRRYKGAKRAATKASARKTRVVNSRKK